MSEELEPPKVDTPPTDTNGGNPPDGAKKAEKDPVPYERFKEVNDRLKSLEKALSEKEKADAAAEEARLKEQGKFKELHDAAAAKVAELEPYKTKAERYEAALTAQLNKAREGLPKAVLTLLDRLDPAEQLEYIAANRAELVPEKAQANGVGANPNASNGKGLTSEELERARRENAGSIRRLF